MKFTEDEHKYLRFLANWVEKKENSTLVTNYPIKVSVKTATVIKQAIYYNLDGIDFIKKCPYMKHKFYKLNQEWYITYWFTNSKFYKNYVYIPVKEGVVYFCLCINGNIKIGCTGNLHRRLKQQSKLIECLGYIKTKDMYKLESAIHKKFEIYRIYSEYFKVPKSKVYALEGFIVLNKKIRET